MLREDMVARLPGRRQAWDILVIGGGATGLGAAVDAATRGYDVCLLERADFASGTSSRSTKLVHGGVRYLQQGNVSLVMEALRERGRLLRNAPHLVDDLAFVVPSYAWWESPWYGVGLKVYDTLAGRYGFGRSRHLSKDEVVRAIPSIETEGLRGGTLYYDGQFDDARLAINLAQTAADHGATLLNYCGVTGLMKSEGGAVEGVIAEDGETGERFEARARAVINATGPFSDAVRRMDHPEGEGIIRASRGSHVVLPASFLPGDHAVMAPHTKDGRVMFAIPWRGVCVVGTTDVAVEEVPREPRASEQEIDLILETANRYLARDAARDDVLSVFAGIRPLVGGGGRTASVSRDHSILIDQHSGLITIAGGKWTTYRRMAEEVVDQAAMLADLAPAACITRDLVVHGGEGGADGGVYGSDAQAIAELERSEEGMSERVHPDLEVTCAQVVWACRAEMARSVEDVLCRRTRAMVLDARAAVRGSRAVAGVMARELGRDQVWLEAEVEAFEAVASCAIVGG